MLMDGLEEAEENTLRCLGSGHRLLYELASTRKLASIKRLHEETVERWAGRLALVTLGPRGKGCV